MATMDEYERMHDSLVKVATEENLSRLDVLTFLMGELAMVALVCSETDDFFNDVLEETRGLFKSAKKQD